MRRRSELQQEATDSQHRRLALGMRDNLAQNLVALKLDITMLHARTGATQPLLHTRAAQALCTLDSCIDNIRDIINELHPLTLELGLCAAVEWQLQQMQRQQGLQYKLSVLDDSARLNPQQTNALFHIVQSGLDYLCSSASLLQVALKLSGEGIAITLGSDRRPDAATAADEVALNDIRRRLRTLGGTLHSAPHALHISAPCSSDRYQTS